MKTCKKCNEKIPWRIRLNNGKILCATTRSYCFVCSPPGTRIKLGRDGIPTTEIKDGKTYRICSMCKVSKEEIKENFYQRARGGFNSYCKICDIKVMMDRVKKLKAKCIEYKGGKCCKCGYNKYNGSLDFHHTNPSEKDFDIAERKTHNFEKLKVELDKCILVCKNCHGEIHGGITI